MTITVVALLGGCHLVFPFGVQDAQVTGSEGLAADAETPASETGPDAPADAVADGGLADTTTSEAGPDALADAVWDGAGTAPLNYLWHQALGGTSNEGGRNVAVDGNGNVYLTGDFWGTSDLGGGSVTSKGWDDIFATSFTGAGTHRWQVAMGGAGIDYGHGVAVDGSGNVYVIGFFQGTATLGGGKVTSAGAQDLFLTSFTSTGAPRWQKALGGPTYDSGTGVAVDGSGNVYLTGYFEGTADLGGGNITSAGGQDIFVTSFNSAGTHRWQKALGGAFGDFGNGVAVDGSGNVYLTGFFEGTADLGGGNIASTGQSDAFVTSFTSTGTHRWQRAFGGASGVSGNGVSVDSSGNVYLIGHFPGTADLGGGDVTSKGQTDVFVTSLTATGAHRWQMALGGPQNDYGYGVAADSSGNVYLTGSFSGTADLGGGNVTTNGGYDVFLVKLGP